MMGSMPLDKIHLSKLMALCYLPPKYLNPTLRIDIRREKANKQNRKTGGPDFYGAFWGDVKKHVAGTSDLHDTVAFRIGRNSGRHRLYNALRQGFLSWWNTKRRWTNEPFKVVVGPHATFALDKDTTVKIENVLAVRDAAEIDHFVYPYFSEHAPLDEEGGRLCLWALKKALPQIPENELRVLDVVHGQVFSLDRSPLIGTEEDVLKEKLERVRQRRAQLRCEYEMDD